MALVQTLPVPSDHPKSSIEVQCHSVLHSPSSVGAMGSVSSLISGHTYQERHCRADQFGANCRKPTPATSCFRQQEAPLRPGSSQELLLNNSLPTKRQPTVTAGNGNYGYLNKDVVGDWNDNHVTPSSPCSDSEEARDNRLLNGNIRGPPPKLIPVSVLNGNIRGPPPKLIPVSGKLEKNMEKNLIRPTAFKPVRGPQRQEQPVLHHVRLRAQLAVQPAHVQQRGLQPGPRRGPRGPAGAHQSGAGHGHSSDSGRSSSSKSTGSLSGRGRPLSDSGSCGARSPAPGEGYEAVIRDLEDKLRDRDLELQQLRENLDENEAAICQVYEEKQKRCEQELEELRQTCSSRMKQVSQKAVRAQQVMQLQVFQLQQEKKKLQEDFSQLLQEHELLEKKCASIQREQTQLGPRLEETKWEVCQKSGEISLLKQQLKEVQVELSQKAAEMVALKAQLREAQGELQASHAHTQEAQAAARTRTLELEVCQNELQRHKSEAQLLREKVGRLEDALSGPSSAHKGQSLGVSSLQGRGTALSPSHREEEQQQQLLAYESDEAKARRLGADALQGLRGQVERLRAELMLERRRSEDQLGAFEDERRVWQEEKEKVIRYQKQLQQNYIQMYRRNRDLERVMRELSLELETRELEEFELRGNEIHFEEIAATEI
ncbi:hypothetical protein AAFF_G00138020 [Aldrovandia affinis]|uniref:Uncharacterized protein n=1 Tax=Aldrovandia affinis TaxID=143900 RepID=A0AAD7X2S5_9TELE|nr:hypothetical protein AAFF_G00138020 [Aldrovandia affinis]